ncbi:MAG: Heat shock protein 60 family co-chaperone GroES, partial [uncultured Microvirga sp.]
GSSPGGRGEDQGWHHHPRHRQGEAPGGRDRGGRPGRPRRSRQARRPGRESRRPRAVRQVVRHRGEDRRPGPPHHEGVRHHG